MSRQRVTPILVDEEALKWAASVLEANHELRGQGSFEGDAGLAVAAYLAFLKNREGAA